MRGKSGPIPKRETLGARLVSRGVVTQEQVDEAVEAQVIFGGRIGTNLLELGYVDEDTLTAVLSEQHKVPALPPGVTDPEPEREALGLIPADLVASYRVLPLRREGKRLHVLMENPSDLAQVDELAFRTGFIIKPQVAAEARIAFLLERYFGIRRETRYIMLSRDGGKMSQGRIHESIDVETASMGIEETHWETDEMIRRELEVPGEEPPKAREITAEEIEANARIAAQAARETAAGCGPDRPGREAPRTDRAGEARGAPAAPPGEGRLRPRPPVASRGTAKPDADFPGGRIGRRLKRAAMRLVGGPSQEKNDEAEPLGPLTGDPPATQIDPEALSMELTREFEAAEAGAPMLSVEAAVAALEAVEDRDGVGRILLEFSRGRCRRAALFILQGGVFLGWAGRGDGVDVAALRALRLPADVPSILQTASSTRSHMIGTLSDSGYAEADTAILSVLGGGAPEAAILIPLIVKNRVVAVLYADNGNGSAPPESIGAFLAVAEQIPKAFGALLRKRKAMVA